MSNMYKINCSCMLRIGEYVQSQRLLHDWEVKGIVTGSMKATFKRSMFTIDLNDERLNCLLNDTIGSIV